MIIPQTAGDGFNIADFIKDTLTAQEFSNIATSLYSYNISTFDVELIHPITNLRKSFSPLEPDDENETFWCFWRDASNYEVYDLLNLSFIYNENSGDIYTDYIFPDFYAKLVLNKTLQWSGDNRNKKQKNLH